MANEIARFFNMEDLKNSWSFEFIFMCWFIILIETSLMDSLVFFGSRDLSGLDRDAQVCLISL